MQYFSNFETKFFKLFATVYFFKYRLSITYSLIFTFSKCQSKSINFFFSFLGLIEYRFILYFFEYRFPTLVFRVNYKQDFFIL